MKERPPYYKLHQLERIIDALLISLTLIGIISLITLKFGENDKMLTDILVNIGCSVVTSIALSLFIYFKFLKKIPDENEKKINELLNSRLNYETSNHNTVLSALNPDNRELSHEHDAIIAALNEIKVTEAVKKDRYARLQAEQRTVVDSVGKLSCFSDMLLKLNSENLALKEKLHKLQLENQQLRAPQHRRSAHNEREYDLEREI